MNDQPFEYSQTYSLTRLVQSYMLLISHTTVTAAFSKTIAVYGRNMNTFLSLSCSELSRHQRYGL